MEFRVLGPLEVRDAGREVPVGGRVQRTVLALLLARVNEVVAADRLIDEVWGESPPDTAAKTLQTYIYRLRKELGADALVSRGSGYGLSVDPTAVDSVRFEEGAATGAAALAEERFEEAAAALSEALALWQGRPFEDLAYEACLQPEIRRLEELQVTATENRIEADLSLGKHAQLVAELEVLTRRHPLRERMRYLHMLALYRAGRQAEALRTFQQTRLVLADELGLEPSAALRRLEQQILEQDPTLGAVTEPPPPATDPRRGLIPTGDGPATRKKTKAVRRETFYAELDGARIACMRLGSGELDLVWLPAHVTHVDMLWADPVARGFLQRLGEHARIVYFDKLGAGLSDPVTSIPTLEDRIRELSAVMDAAGIERAAIVGASEGAGAAMGFASMHPERVSHLLLLSPIASPPMPEVLEEDFDVSGLRKRLLESARSIGRDDPEVCVPSEAQLVRFREVNLNIIRHWGDGSSMGMMLPSLGASQTQRAIFERSCASPGMATAAVSSLMFIDALTAAAGVQAPTLLIHDADDVIPVANSRLLHQVIAGSEYYEHPGRDHAPYLGPDSDEVLARMVKFLTGVEPRPQSQRCLSTILVCDVLAPAGAAEGFESRIRGAVEGYGGALVKRLGDRFLTRFTGPVAALAAAERLHSLAGGQHIGLRAGAHTGEVEVTNSDVRGLAVSVAAGICEQAAEGTTLVSRTVRDLAVGSGLPFHVQGAFQFEGMPRSVELLGVGPDPKTGESMVDPVASIPTPPAREQQGLRDRFVVRMASLFSPR